MRVIGCLPGDIVTIYLGATNIPYLTNLVTGSLGILPGMILATLIGENIQNAKSPVFWGSTVLTFVLSIFSVLLYYIYKRKQKNKTVLIRPNKSK